MSSGLDHIQKVYESTFNIVHARELHTVTETRKAVIEFATNLTNALQFPQWKLGKVLEESESKRIPVDDKGYVLVDEEGKITVDLYWPIEVKFGGNPVSLDVGWTFFLLPRALGYMATTARKPHVEWDFRDEKALRSEVEFVLDTVSEHIVDRASEDARNEVLSNHTQPRRQ